MTARTRVLSGVVIFLCGVLIGSSLYALREPPSRDTSFYVNFDRVSAGYVLIAPYVSKPHYNKPGEVLLINEVGSVVHTWNTKYQPLVAYLQPSGHLYVAMTPPVNPADFPSPGSTGLIQELDWDGNVIWEYADSQMTHDFEIMPDGGVAYIRWHKASPEFGREVRGGIAVVSTNVYTNEVVVVARDKSTTWTWIPEDHLKVQDYTLGSLIPRDDWAHFNSIRYTPKNPLTNTPAFMISSRHLDTVFIVDAKDGHIVWQSPKDLFAAQHDATFLANGNILVFDNGLFRNVPAPLLASRVLEVNPEHNKTLWKYPTAEMTPLEHAQFASSIMGGAQRLSNGNTLITESTANTIIEVTPGGDTVWSFTEYFRDADGPRAFFKARKYNAEGSAWGSRVRTIPTVSEIVRRF